MSELFAIQEQLHRTNAEISRVDQLIATHPQEAIPLMIDVQSLKKRQMKLESEFLRLAGLSGVDVCSYRLLLSDSESRPSVWSLANALRDFQRCLSILYDAIKTGPKQKAHLSAEIVQATTLRFGYSYPGSVGIVFTVPSEQLLFGASALEQAAKTLAKMAKATGPQNIREFVGTFGRASVRAVSQWVDHHARAGLGANVEWLRGEEVHTLMLIQQPEFAALRAILAATGDTRTERVEVIGELRGADITQRHFRLLLDNDTVIRGSFADAISHDHVVQLPKRYRAVLVQTTTVQYTAEKDEISYFLQSLEPTG